MEVYQNPIMEYEEKPSAAADGFVVVDIILQLQILPDFLVYPHPAPYIRQHNRLKAEEGLLQELEQ